MLSADESEMLREMAPELMHELDRLRKLEWRATRILAVWNDMRLVEEEYCWAVSIVSKDDGHHGYACYFTDREKAAERAKAMQGNVVQVTLWKDQYGRYYRAKPEPVTVNLPTKQEALAKLTEADMEALGIQH